MLASPLRKVLPMSFNFPSPRPDLTQTPAPQVIDRRRPRLLLSAARHGLALYRRDRDLPRLIARAQGQSPLEALTEAESRMESARRGGGATYAFARHIELLIALLAEERLRK